MISSVMLRRCRYAALAFTLALPATGSLGVLSAHAQETTQAADASGRNLTPEHNVPEKREEVKDENDAYRHSAMVKKLGGMLGMNVEQAATAFEVFNFVVLAAAVGIFAVKALPKAFRKRSSDIQKHLVEARTATEEASARLSSVEARLSKLDGEIAAMKTQMEADNKRDELRIKASVEEETAKIVAAADAEIKTATSTARRDLQRYAAELAVEHAAKRLTVSAETDRLLVASFAQRLGMTGGEGN